jgi:N-acetylmuramoyl-L-alanine amidase
LFSTGTFASSLAGKVIVLDPGHGCKNIKGQIVNGGCSSRDGLHERDKTVGISKILGNILLEHGTTVYFTRDAEHFWRSAESQDEDNKSRAEFANSKNADLFLRLHCNWSPDKKQRGVLVLWYKDDSKKIAEAVFAELKKTGVRIEGIRKQHLVGFQFAEVPAILIEYGYLSNKDDEKLLKDDEYIKKISEAAASGMENYYSSAISTHAVTGN